MIVIASFLSSGKT